MSDVLMMERVGSEMGIAWICICSVIVAFDRYKYTRFADGYCSLRGNCDLQGCVWCGVFCFVRVDNGHYYCLFQGECGLQFCTSIFLRDHIHG